MNTKFLIPVVAIAISLLLVISAGFNLKANATSEANISYFIKPVQSGELLIVEPNLLEFVGTELTAKNPVENLLSSLEEIGQNYTINGVRQIQSERRNGRTVPTLVVSVQPKELQPADVADVIAIK